MPDETAGNGWYVVCKRLAFQLLAVLVINDNLLVGSHCQQQVAHGDSLAEPFLRMDGARLSFTVDDGQTACRHYPKTTVVVS